MTSCPWYQPWQCELAEDELLVAAMFFQFTDYWRNNIDRPLNLFNTTEVLKTKQSLKLGSALNDFQSRWLRISNWESGISIRLKCKNTFKSNSIRMSQVQVQVLKNGTRVGLESKSWTRVLHLCSTCKSMSCTRGDYRFREWVNK